LYAEAVARGEADINRCPPGDITTINALARLMGVAGKSPDPACGAHKPRLRAVIDEAVCIGCRKCIDACPVDAILGARKLMHTVIAGECSGCELCLAPCPVDCILMVPAAPTGELLWPEYSREEAGHWRRRTQARLARLEQRKLRDEVRKSARAPSDAAKESLRRKAEIRAAVERVKQKRRLGPK
jgi:electron transport complex protein RnfB